MLHVTQMAQEYQELVIFQVLLVEKDIIQTILSFLLDNGRQMIRRAENTTEFLELY